jgi:hypothetical protein
MARPWPSPESGEAGIVSGQYNYARVLIGAFVPGSYPVKKFQLDFRQERRVKKKYKQSGNKNNGTQFPHFFHELFSGRFYLLEKIMISEYRVPPQ